MQRRKQRERCCRVSRFVFSVRPTVIYPDDVFTPEDRRHLKEALIDRAHDDDRVVGAALLGSSSTSAEDEWSDVDLALSVRSDKVDDAIDDWTTVMYQDHRAVHHLDVRWKTALYRVFLLENTLQVDLSFWASEKFVSTGPSFRLLFGEAPPQHVRENRPSEAIIGEAWLYLLHARSSMGRGRYWQANYMIAGVRDHVLELACRRHDLRTDHARGVDDLPAAMLDDYASMLPRTLGELDLQKALSATTARLIDEAHETEPELMERIKGPLQTIGSSAPLRSAADR